MLGDEVQADLDRVWDEWQDAEGMRIPAQIRRAVGIPFLWEEAKEGPICTRN